MLETLARSSSTHCSGATPDQCRRRPAARIMAGQRSSLCEDASDAISSYRQQWLACHFSPSTIGLKNIIGGLMVLSKYPFYAPAEFRSYKSFTRPEEYFAGKGCKWFRSAWRANFAFAHTHLGSSHFDSETNDFKPKQIRAHVRQIEEMGQMLADAVVDLRNVDSVLTSSRPET